MDRREPSTRRLILGCLAFIVAAIVLGAVWPWLIR